jgi:hypothetical protein
VLTAKLGNNFTIPALHELEHENSTIMPVGRKNKTHLEMQFPQEQNAYDTSRTNAVH